MRKFGVITSMTGVESGFVCTGLTRSGGADIAEARNGEGKVTDLIAYSRNKSISISGLLDVQEGKPLPQAGDVLTLEGEEYLIESCDQTESNTDYVQVSISARRADDAAITPIAAEPDEEVP